MNARVMVVDDAPDIRRLLVLVLSMAGCTVTEADGGAEALRQLAHDPLPDILILDVQMPDLDGWETLELMRADPRLARIAVILCTVKGLVEDKLRAWTLGCDGFVTKPIDLTGLVTHVEDVLARDADARWAHRDEKVRQLSGG